MLVLIYRVMAFYILMIFLIFSFGKNYKKRLGDWVMSVTMLVLIFFLYFKAGLLWFTYFIRFFFEKVIKYWQKSNEKIIHIYCVVILNNIFSINIIVFFQNTINLLYIYLVKNIIMNKKNKWFYNYKYLKIFITYEKKKRF